tara:strand:- start:2032 stop:2217 length:186 start_codon:yes stop_codon:yes gene_type:complete
MYLVGMGWIRTSEGISRPVYSRDPLTAWIHTQNTLVERAGFEPATSGISIQRSYQLSYRSS